MPLSERAYLEHIRSACLEIARDLAQAGPRELEEASAIRNSILYSLIIIGEAVNQLPFALLSLYPEIPWRRIVDLRNVLTHQVVIPFTQPAPTSCACCFEDLGSGSV